MPHRIIGVRTTYGRKQRGGEGGCQSSSLVTDQVVSNSGQRPLLDKCMLCVSLFKPQRYVCEASAPYYCQMHAHARCASVHCTSNIPDLAVQGFADGDCSGDVIIPRPWHHDLCVALTCIAVLHLHRQTCSALRMMCISMSPQTAGLIWCCISPAQIDSQRLMSSQVFLGACSCTMQHRKPIIEDCEEASKLSVSHCSVSTLVQGFQRCRLQRPRHQSSYIWALIILQLATQYRL